MCCNPIRLCFVLLQLVGFTQSVNYNSIVRLSCKKCPSNVMNCCVGSLIAPSLVISTTFCADSCQFIVEKDKNNPIVTTYLCPRNGNVIRKNINDRGNDIALIAFDSKNQKYLKLGAVEPLSSIGLKAVIPLLHDDETHLKSSVILPCDSQYRTLRGYYICTSKDFEKKSHWQIQGIPLLLHDFIIGVSGSNDEHLTQNAFIAVGPLLSWIEITADLKRKNGNGDKRMTNINPQFIDEHVKIKHKLQNVFTRNKIPIKNNLRTVYDSIENTQSHNTLTTHKINFKKTNTKVNNFLSTIQKKKKFNLRKKKNLRTENPPALNNSISVLTDTTFTVPIIQNFNTIGFGYSNKSKDDNKQITIILPIVESPIDRERPMNFKISTDATIKPINATINLMSTSNTSKSNSTTITKSRLTEDKSTSVLPVVMEIPTSASSMSLVNLTKILSMSSTHDTTNSKLKQLTTNVMQWFKNKKNELSNKPPVMLVLTTFYTTAKSAEFIDLT